MMIFDPKEVKSVRNVMKNQFYEKEQYFIGDGTRRWNEVNRKNIFGEGRNVKLFCISCTKFRFKIKDCTVFCSENDSRFNIQNSNVFYMFSL